MTVDEITPLLKELRVDYEDITEADMPVNINHYLNILENTSSKKSIDFRNIYHKVNKTLFHSIEKRCDNFTSLLMQYQQFYNEYTALLKKLNQMRINTERIKENLNIDFEGLKNRREVIENENLHKYILNELKKLYAVHREFNENFLQLKIYYEKKKDRSVLQGFKGKITKYKEYIQRSLLFIEKYNLTSNDCIYEYRIEVEKNRRNFSNFLSREIINNFIFNSGSMNDLHIYLRVLRDFNCLNDFFTALKNAFSLNLFKKLTRITKNYTINKFNIKSVKFSTFDYNRVNRKNSEKSDMGNILEIEIIASLLFLIKNMEIVKFKLEDYNFKFKFAYLTEIVEEMKKIYIPVEYVNMDSTNTVIFDINKVVDMTDYSFIDSNVILKKAFEGKISNEKYSMDRSYELKTNLNNLIILWKESSNEMRLKHMLENRNSLDSEINKKQIEFLKKIITFSYEEIKKQTGEYDRHLNTYILNITEEKSSEYFSLDYYTKNLVFYQNFIKKIEKFNLCINFIDYKKYFNLIMQRIIALYKLDKQYDIENIKDSYSPKLYAEMDFNNLMGAYTTITNLYFYLLVNIKNIKGTLRERERDDSELESLLKQYENMTRSILLLFKYKVYELIYNSIELYLREGGYKNIVFNHIKNIFLSFTYSYKSIRKNEKKLWKGGKELIDEFYEGSGNIDEYFFNEIFPLINNLIMTSKYIKGKSESEIEDIVSVVQLTDELLNSIYADYAPDSLNDSIIYLKK